MNKIILITLFSLLSLTTAQAYTLEATSVKDLINTIQNTKFTYKERGMVFGYDTIQSCLYLSKDLIVIKNYCYPAKPYPAKSYTVISKKYGTVDFYHEEFAPEVKHDVRISMFPAVVQDYFSQSLDTESIASINVNFKKIYTTRLPACWSTNFAFGTGQPDYGCHLATIDDVINLQTWYDETQALAADYKTWDAVLQGIETAIKK